jgi:3-oxoacyl-[acyl-carrier protein] reductase
VGRNPVNPVGAAGVANVSVVEDARAAVGEAGAPRLRDGCALVTGASRGIGAAIACALAAEGWPVAVNFRADEQAAGETVERIQEGDGRALAVRADVTQPAELERLFETAERELGRVLVLVNNAGVRHDDLAISMSDTGWAHVIDTNLTSAFRATRYALRGMIRERFGRVINLASVVGPRANAGQANYAAAKAGLIGMTKTIAVEVARRGVTVNAVAPGLIATDMTADLGLSAEGDGALLEAIPARRAGRPEEVAACVRFLASEQAGYVTGTTLYVDGGLSA